EQACGLVAVELEQDAQRDHLALGRRERIERHPEDRRQHAREAGLADIRRLGAVPLLPPPAPLLAAKVVERRVPGDPAEPRAGRRPARVEAAPRAKRLLEGLARQ